MAEKPRFDIRPVVHSEFEALAAVARDTFREHFTEGNDPEHLEAYLSMLTADALRSEAEKEGAEFWVAVDEDGSFAGYFKTRFKRNREPSIPGANPMEIERIYERQSVVGTGLLSDLLRVARNRAKERGADVLYFAIWERSPGTIEYFGTQGFHEVGHTSFDLGGDRQRDIVLAVHL